MQKTKEAARNLAKELLRPYVERGDSLNAITEGHMAWGWKGFRAQIGACIWKHGKSRQYSRYDLVVSQFAGQDCLLVFSVTDLIADIRARLVQPSLWEESVP